MHSFITVHQPEIIPMTKTSLSVISATFVVVTLTGGTAQAQSLNHSMPSTDFIEFSGMVDLAVGKVVNANSAGKRSDVTEVHPNGINGSLMRSRGRENLGGGNFAGYWLETVVSADTGVVNDSAGRFFNRASAVYLGGNWGEIALGRQSAPTFTSLAIYDPSSNNGYLQGLKILSSLGTDIDSIYRNDNAVSYFLPKDVGGINGHIQYAAGEGLPNREYLGSRIGYAAGPLNVGIASGNTKTTPGNPNYQMSNVGGSYDFSRLKLMGFAVRVRYGALNQTEYLAGAQIPLGPYSIRLSYAKTKGQGSATVGTDSYSLGATLIYSFSSRTSIYSNFSTIRNSGVAAFRTIPSANTSSAQGGYSNGIDFGIRHAF